MPRPHRLIHQTAWTLGREPAPALRQAPCLRTHIIIIIIILLLYYYLFGKRRACARILLLSLLLLYYYYYIIYSASAVPAHAYVRERHAHACVCACAGRHAGVQHACPCVQTHRRRYSNGLYRLWPIQGCSCSQSTNTPSATPRYNRVSMHISGPTSPR